MVVQNTHSSKQTQRTLDNLKKYKNANAFQNSYFKHMGWTIVSNNMEHTCVTAIHCICPSRTSAFSRTSSTAVTVISSGVNIYRHCCLEQPASLHDVQLSSRCRTSKSGYPIKWKAIVCWQGCNAFKNYWKFQMILINRPRVLVMPQATRHFHVKTIVWYERA